MSGRAIAAPLGVARGTVAAALASSASSGPPKYARARSGSGVDEFVPAIRRLLAGTPSMPASVIAERVGWTGGRTVFRARVAQLKAQLAVPDPADRLQFEPGEMVQADLWFPGKVIPDGAGADVPVLSMVCAFSRFLAAVMVPSRRTGDLVAGMAVLLAVIGGAPRKVLWDNEARIGRGGRLTGPAAQFAGTLGFAVKQTRPFDPKPKAGWNAPTAISGGRSCPGAVSPASTISTPNSPRGRSGRTPGRSGPPGLGRSISLRWTGPR